MYLARIFNADQPDRQTALGIANYRLINVQKQITGLSDLSDIKLPARTANADDATVLFNGLRTGIARINYMYGILQDANAALKDSLDEIAAGNEKTKQLEESIAILQADTPVQIAQHDDSVARLQGEVTRLRDMLAARDGELRLIQKSRSWRITWPLRAMTGYIARISSR